MALHTALLSERQRELVPARMMYPIEPSGLLGTSKIMQYRSPDYGQVFSGETGNNIIRFSVNGVGLLDPRSLYLRWSWKNRSAVPLKHCCPGSYAPIKRVRILSGFNQQILYDQDGYNVFCAFLDDYQKSVHDLVMENHGFFATRASRYGTATTGVPHSAGLDTDYSDNYISTLPVNANPGLVAEMPQWEFRPIAATVTSTEAAGDPYADKEWPAYDPSSPSANKIFSICDLPHIGMFTQGRYIPLWALGGLIIELHLDHAQNWATVSNAKGAGEAPTYLSGAPAAGAVIEIEDVELFYDNIQPPAKFLETMQDVIAKGDGISLVFPSVNRHLNSIRAMAANSKNREELLVPDHSRMAQAIFQIFRYQPRVTDWHQVYKLHARCPAGLVTWQAKMNSTYLPQQPLRANRNGGAATGAPLGKKYLQFHKELLKALGQSRQVKGSITPAQYEIDHSLYTVADANKPLTATGYQLAQKGGFAVGVDLTVSDDVITGTNLRNATVTGEMFINLERSNENDYEMPAVEVQTYIMKLSQIRITAAGPILVD